MNERNDTHDATVEPLPEALRFRLRALREDTPLEGDPWPGIAARLAPRDAPPRHRAQRRWAVPAAMAASLVAVVALVARPGPDTTAPVAHGDGAATPTLVSAPPPVFEGYQREAWGLSRQYEAAFRQIDPLGVDPGMRPVIDDLDRNATLILDALAEQPDSRLLLEQLRRTYAHRLAVSQRTLDT